MKLFTGIFVALLTIIDTTLVHEVRWQYHTSFSLEKQLRSRIPSDFLPQITHEEGMMSIPADHFCSKACQYVYRNYGGSYSYGLMTRKWLSDSNPELLFALRCEASYNGSSSDIDIVKEGNTYNVYTVLQQQDILMQQAAAPPSLDM